MDDLTLLKSAGLYKKDIATGQEGLTLAAILLFGKDETILSGSDPKLIEESISEQIF